MFYLEYFQFLEYMKIHDNYNTFSFLVFKIKINEFLGFMPLNPIKDIIFLAILVNP